MLLFLREADEEGMHTEDQFEGGSLLSHSVFFVGFWLMEGEEVMERRRGKKKETKTEAKRKKYVLITKNDIFLSDIIEYFG